MTVTNKIKLSIIIPVFNVDEYLNACLKSLIKSVKDGIEVILIDDGSTDDSPLICDRYAKKYSFVKVKHKKNGGLSSARNAGIDIAKGDWIAFIDSDDLVVNNYCSAILRFITKCSNAEIIMFNYATFYDNEIHFKDIKVNVPTKINKDTAMYYLTTEKWGNYFWSKIFKNSLFQNIKLPVGRNYEDIATMYKYFNLANSIYASDTPLYLYRQRKGSIIHANMLNKKVSSIKEEILSRSEQLSFFEQNKFTRAQKLAEYYLWRAYCWYILIVQDHHLKKDKFYDDALKFNRNYDGTKLEINKKILSIMININPSVAAWIHRKIFFNN